MFYLILLLILGIVLWKVLRSYRLRTHDTIVAFTGGLGSGKSLLSVQTAIKLLKKQRRKVKWKNKFRKKNNRKPEPLLYSSIPVKISRVEKAVILTERHLLLEDKLVEGSVIFLDEIGSFCSQFDFKAKNADVFDEFVRFFRHYTKGGYFVCNDQCSENIVLQVRRRINTVYNLMGFRRWFGIFYTVKVRNISISEEIKTIETEDREDNMTSLFGILPLYRRYDTYCYAPRYGYVDSGNDKKFKNMTKLDILRLPKREVTTIDTKIKKDREEKQKNQEISENTLTQ